MAMSNEEKKHTKKHNSGEKPDRPRVTPPTIITPEPGSTLTGSSFDISGGSVCKNVVINVIDLDTNIVIKTVTVPVNNGYYTYPYNEQGSYSHVGISVTCAEDAMASCFLSGLSINMSNSSFRSLSHPINAQLHLTLSADPGTKKLQCDVQNPYSKTNDVYFIRFVQYFNSQKIKVQGIAHEYNPNNSTSKSEHVVETGKFYFAHVIYSDDTDIFCSYVAKKF